MIPVLLRLSFSLTCIAYAWGIYNYSCKVFSYLWAELECAESLADTVESLMIGGLLLSAVCVWFERLRWFALLGMIALVIEMLAETLVPSAKYPYLYWAEWMLRYSTPVVLIMLLGSRQWSRRGGVLLMRVAVACVFAAHGMKALYSDPQFLDLILVTARKVGFVMSESAATGVVHLIGATDLLFAGIALFAKSKRLSWVLWALAAWGIITALSRVSYGGVGNWYEVFARSSHCLVPIALWLHLRKERK
ncbi:hypothetical protein [Pelagicoccus mobilis]|uniref:Uncharacterized protein n=1 Tax=Pelagicoccus mobilis TaxID=415221 RepID=A0A934S4Y3_9BACT|nr:hypothetical protein [Pelagicoccus mobilis]MBK1879852.1 hypothetical protein [Pelagicoccus mobilis]